MTALEYLKSLPYLPGSRERGRIGRPSNQELRRWLDKGCVLINGKYSKYTDEVSLPIKQLVFFPNNDKQRVTMLWEEEE